MPTAFILGPPSNLGLYFDEATRELRINIKQDYEDSIFVTDYPDRRYAFTITAGSEFVEIFLTITNVNDNSPLIQAQSASCQIEVRYIHISIYFVYFILISDNRNCLVHIIHIKFNVLTFM